MATVFNDANEKIGQRFKYNNKYFYVYDIELDGDNLATDAPSGAFAFSKDGVSEGKIYTVNGGFWMEYGGGEGGAISEDDFTNLLTSLDESSRVSPNDEIAINQNDIIVSGAGSAAANGTYSYRGRHNGRAFYNEVGEVNSTVSKVVAWSGSLWYISNEGDWYLSNDDVLTPDLATTWEIDGGELPVSIVTAVPISRKATVENIFKADFPTGMLDPSAQFLALQNDIVISGAGTAAVNLTTGYFKQTDRRPEHRLGDIAVRWVAESSVWRVYEGGTVRYYSEDDVATADLVTAWQLDDADSPVPTVTAVPSLKSVLPWQIVNRGSVPHTDIDNELVVTNEDCGKIFNDFGAGGIVTFSLDDNNFDEGWWATFETGSNGGGGLAVNRVGASNIYGQFVFWDTQGIPAPIASIRNLNTCCIRTETPPSSITLRKAGGKLNITAVTGNWFDND